MPFSKCSDVIERISDILDGRASLVARARFYSHLAMCDQCTLYFEQFRAVKEAAAVVLPEDLPSDFESVLDFVLAEIDADKTAADQGGSGAPEPPSE
jgi:anti-sigma factor RsiW